MNKAIISPSGGFYGSEQTLFTFLTQTSNNYDVYIKTRKEGLLSKVKNLNNHNYFSFSNTKLLYINLLFKLCYKYDLIYINEGGHIKYVKLLALLFPKKKFVIHIRLVEDTTVDRIGVLPSNVELISVSDYIASLIFEQNQITTQIISSPTRGFASSPKWNFDFNSKSIINIGVIGRVTESKRLSNIVKFVNYLEVNSITKFHIHFFGTVELWNKPVEKFVEDAKKLNFVDIHFHGYQQNKDEMYNSLDVVVHFNENEPLGVIFLEALNQGVPFIGFNSGGIGDIAEKINLNHYMVFGEKWILELIENIERIKIVDFQNAQKLALEKYSPKAYCKRLEEVIQN